ncbi:MAG: transposase [Paracoccaceae bacterium]
MAAAPNEQCFERHLAKYSVVAPSRRVSLSRLQATIDDPERCRPEAAVDHARLLPDHIAASTGEVTALKAEIRREAQKDDVAKRLMITPGVGPITAIARSALPPEPSMLSKRCGFAAWADFTPKQFSSGGKECIVRT